MVIVPVSNNGINKKNFMDMLMVAESVTYVNNPVFLASIFSVFFFVCSCTCTGKMSIKSVIK